MSELVPGTVEYKEAYDKEMQRLEAESDPIKKVEEEATTSPEVKEPENKEVPKTEEKAGLDEDSKKRLDSLEKALRDTQAWGTRQSQELARLKKEREDEKHNARRPEILDQNPGLEDAIKHVARPVSEEKSPQARWLENVQQAIPDVEKLLGDKGFYEKAQAKRNEFGSDWDNPLVAIRELSELKTEHVKTIAIHGAVEQARKDFEVKSKKRTAMEVPGGSGASVQSKTEDEAKKMWDMSEADFQKMRSRTLGY
jgi:hypothetical protein